MGWQGLALESGSVTLMALLVALLMSAIAPQSTAAPLPRTACPAQVEPLVALMLGNLAGYTNRAIAQSTPRGNLNRSHVLTVGRPEFEPLPLSPGGGSLGTSPNPPDPNLRQVFITTLERQTLSRPSPWRENRRENRRDIPHESTRRNTEVYLQGFHWLFLTKTGTEWQLALMFSQIGTYPRSRFAEGSTGSRDTPLTPPRESSQGILGQAIQTWLRDCNAGAIRPIKSDNLFDKTG